MRSPAWIARGLLDCDEGMLELDGRALRFVAASGEVVLDVELDEGSVSFPWWFWGIGLIVRAGRRLYRIWFLNPYVGMGGLIGAPPAQAVGREWRRALRRRT